MIHRTTAFVLLVASTAVHVTGGCTRSGFPGSRDGSVHTADAASQDGPVLLTDLDATPERDHTQSEVGGGGGADANTETGVDAAAPLPALICQQASPLAATSASLAEPAIRIDGLTLYATAKSSPGNIYTTSRADHDSPYGSWQVLSTEQPFMADLFFFADQQGVEQVMLARSTGTENPRILQRCNTQLTSCSTLTLIEEGSGKVITADVDGPSLFKTAAGLTMGFNVKENGDDVGSVDTWLGQPVSSDLLIWRASPLPQLSDPTIEEDDPCFNSDGTIVVFRSGGELMVSYRASLVDDFSQPEPLTALNTDAMETGALLFTRADGLIELYFARGEPAMEESFVIQRSLCEVHFTK